VVLIGGSYIGTEVAASLTELGSSCTIVMLEPVVLSRTFGEQAGRFFQERLTEHGIVIHGEDELERFEGADGRVSTVVTKSGRSLDADAVVIGAGAVPDVMLARSAGLELGDGGGVKVDARLATSAPGIYAAGDTAEYESVVHDGRRIRVEHWDVALTQGRTAALNMLGPTSPTTSCPTSSPTCPTGPRSSTSGRRSNGTRRSSAARSTRARSASGTCIEGRVAAALSVGRSEDLMHARRLIAAGGELGGRGAELADLGADLSEL
jgi:3-phenylpropionate/trans-cinnamate dioxygenase ferredoxin reductase subunit